MSIVEFFISSEHKHSLCGKCPKLHAFGSDLVCAINNKKVFDLKIFTSKSSDVEGGFVLDAALNPEESFEIPEDCNFALEYALAERNEL